MTKRVLLVGLKPDLVAEFRRQLDLPDVEFLGCSNVAEVRAVFADADVDHVFLGGGLDVPTRLEVIQEIFRSSDRATAHLKDHMSGPEGFVPFARAVLGGLADYEPKQSAQAVLRAQRDDAE